MFLVRALRRADQSVSKQVKNSLIIVATGVKNIKAKTFSLEVEFLLILTYPCIGIQNQENLNLIHKT